MDKVIICGTDAHDNFLVNRIGIGKRIVRTVEVRNTKKGRGSLFKYLQKLSKQEGGAKVLLAYEASPLGFGLYDDCMEAGINCYVLAPHKISRSQKDRKNKNDKYDAQKIMEVLRGHVLAGNDLPSVWVPDKARRDDREIVRQRLDIADKIRVVKNQIQMLLKRNGMKKPIGMGANWTKKYREWLKTVTFRKGSRIAMDSLVRQLANLEKEAEVLDKEVEKLSADKKYTKEAEVLVEKIKGVGLLTAMVYLTEMGDLSRFKNRKRVGSFLGLAPSSHESGEDDNRKGHITRQGPARIRRVLCQATWSRVAHDKKEGRIYEKIVERNPKHKKIAVVASMRRLGIQMWHTALAVNREEKKQTCKGKAA